jgi:hypothetical protein
MTIEDDAGHYLNRLKYPKLNLTLQPFNNADKQQSLFNTAISPALIENQAAINTILSSMDCATALLQQSLSNAVHI